MKKEKSIPRSIRFPERVWKMAKEKAEYLGMKTPSYLRQLVVKDNSKKS